MRGNLSSADEGHLLSLINEQLLAAGDLAAFQGQNMLSICS